MNWITLSVGLIISSVITYLLLRKSQDQGLNIEWRNLSFFFPPFLFYGIYNILYGISFSLSILDFLAIIGISILFSWLPNLFSLRSLETSPNPGYSLIISKSYVVLSSLLAVLFFGDPFTIKDSVSIALILLFSSFILIEKKKQKKAKNSWIFYSIGAFIGWAFLAISLTYLVQKGLPSSTILFYLMGIVSLIITAEILIKKRELSNLVESWKVFLGMGVFSAIFNLCIILGYKYAPNPGYINAANAGSIALLSLFSWMIFKDELTSKKIIGIIGVFLGLILLFI